MQARFPAGTFERIGQVLREDEDRTDFVRAAVERELQRREKSAE
ncbi:YlcI/YnfO family protein (plasmid) [Novosphingobium sp. BL-8A]